MLRFVEEGGHAIVQLDGAPLDDGPAPAPLDRALQKRIDAVLRTHSAMIRVEVDRTPRWTVQDLVSMCASAARGSSVAVVCAFAPDPPQTPESPVSVP